MTPTPKQQEIINDLHRFKVLVCGRKFGKTEIGVETVLGEALERPNKDLIYIASTFTEARDIVWNRMKKRYAPILVGEPNEARLEMKLRDLKGIGSSLLQLKSWEAVESLRGREFDYVIMDEIQNYKSFWTLYQEVLRPTLMPRKGRALFEGTPKGFNHLYDLFNLEGKDLSFKSFKFNSYDNPYLPKEEIDEMRTQMSEDKFAQECLAEFRKMEDQMWKLAEEGTADSIACNTGQACKNGTPFKMTLVPVSADDEAKVKAASSATVLPMWKATCNKVDAKCSDTWNATVGKARGMKIN